MWSKKRKVITCISTIAIVSIVFVFIYYALIIFDFQGTMINSEPDTSKWTLSNEIYQVIPDIDRKKKSITFHVCDKTNNTVYVANESWRLWDFDSINILENNNIIAISNDVGTSTYLYNSGTWDALDLDH